MKSYTNTMLRALNTPLLIEPGYARTFFSALAGRFGIDQLQDADGEILTGEKMRMSAEAYSPSRDRNQPYQVISGVAVLPVVGTLVHKSGNIQPVSGTTGYDGIIRRASIAFSDPDVNGVMLDNDTPGGEVSGCFDASRTLRKMADESGKQLWSLCYDMNCSAGMALASSAHRRLITQTGVAGSVGVVMAHTSMEAALKESGTKVTIIHSGKFKADGNPYQDLSAEVLARFQEKTDALRLQFAELIAAHLSLSVQQVLATEAAVFQGQEAVDVGFADALVNGHEAIQIFSEYLSSQGRATIAIGANMKNEQAPSANANETPVVAVAGGVDGDPQANADAIHKAKADERNRCKEILTHEEAENRVSLAHHLAFSTELDATAAISTLQASACAETQSHGAGSVLDAAMGNTDQPNIGADHSESSDEEASLADQAIAAFNVATGTVK